MSNLAVIAVVLYIIIVAILFFIPKRRLDARLKKDFEICEREWNILLEIK